MNAKLATFTVLAASQQANKIFFRPVNFDSQESIIISFISFFFLWFFPRGEKAKVSSIRMKKSIRWQSHVYFFEFLASFFKAWVANTISFPAFVCSHFKNYNCMNNLKYLVRLIKISITILRTHFLNNSNFETD